MRGRTNQAKATREAEEQALVIRDVATLKAIADPLRIQILLELSGRARTVKEVASAFGTPTTRLYYHFKILERSGLIRVAGKRLVSGIEERSYEAVHTNWTTSPETTPSLVGSGVVGALLDVVRAELELALLGQDPNVPVGDPEAPVPLLSLTRLALSREDVEEVQKRIYSIMEDFGEEREIPEGKRAYHALFTGFLEPAELRKDGRERGYGAE